MDSKVYLVILFFGVLSTKNLIAPTNTADRFNNLGGRASDDSTRGDYSKRAST